MENKDKVAIITGSSAGLGASVAIGLAKKGVNVVINYSKSKEKAEEIEKICNEYEVETLCVKGNVAFDKDCKHLVDETIKKFNKVDILVNNAGTTKFANHQKLDALTDEDFINIYRVNVVGPYQMIRAVEPHMKKQKYGSVVNVSSIAGKTGIGSSIAYAASKGALNTMTLSLAKSLGPEIRVNTVCPTFVVTPMTKKFLKDKKFKRDMLNNIPLGRFAELSEISSAVVFLASDAASMITGTSLLVDGGWTAK